MLFNSDKNVLSNSVGCYSNVADSTPLAKCSLLSKTALFHTTIQAWKTVAPRAPVSSWWRC